VHRLLIVDDLPVIVDGLEQLFRQTPRLDLEIAKAYSGEEALEVLRSIPVDIVISDIRMPGIEGIELLKLIKEQWQSCIVIFLTGYTDFHYVKSALSYGSFEYILKVESDDKIISTVERAIEKLELESGNREMMERASNRLRLAIPSLRKEYVRGLLQAKHINPGALHQHFSEIDMPLRADLPVLMFLGRVDNWEDKLSVRDRALLIYAVQNISEELLTERMNGFSYVDDSSKILWLIQPRQHSDEHAPLPPTEWDRIYSCARGLLERIQHTCKKLLRLQLSFVIRKSAAEWHEVSGVFHALKYAFVHDVGRYSEVIIIDSQVKQDGPVLGEQDRNYLRKRRMQLLADCLENNRGVEFKQLFDAMTEIWDDAQTSYEQNLELYHAISAILLAYIGQNEQLKRELNGRMDLERLYRYDAGQSWHELRDYFALLVDYLAEWSVTRDPEETDKLIGSVHHYIEEHLATDISLNAVAEYVGLNPSYFSRLYKQMTGMGFSEYVNEYRNLKAKELLLNSSKKVNEIAAELGYNSGLAFIRFFKKMNQATPQEYRTRSAASNR